LTIKEDMLSTTKLSAAILNVVAPVKVLQAVSNQGCRPWNVFKAKTRMGISSAILNYSYCSLGQVKK
jgi:hypothetical protein